MSLGAADALTTFAPFVKSHSGWFLLQDNMFTDGENCVLISSLLLIDYQPLYNYIVQIALQGYYRLPSPIYALEANDVQPFSRVFHRKLVLFLWHLNYLIDSHCLFFFKYFRCYTDTIRYKWCWNTWAAQLIVMVQWPCSNNQVTSWPWQNGTLTFTKNNVTLYQ